MSKRDINLRHNAIINRLNTKPATLKEINDYLKMQSEVMGYKLTVSTRTFLRDIDDILSLYQIEICCNKSKNQYFIKNEEDELRNNRLLDAFNTVNALSFSAGNTDYLQFEEYAARGTENFHGILHAIKNKFQLKIRYQTYWAETSSIKNLQPYLLKEFKNRWYLIAKDVDINEIRTYALDRFKDLEITKIRFTQPKKDIAKHYYDDSFGIIAHDEGEKLVTTILKFESHQGKYILSLPLHKSQEVIKDDKDGLIISLRVHHTFDFIKELLSHGENLKVLEPRSLVSTMKEQLKSTLRQYGSLNFRTEPPVN